MEHKILLGWTANYETFSGFWPQIHSRIHEKVLLWQPVRGIEALTNNQIGKSAKHYAEYLEKCHGKPIFSRELEHCVKVHEHF